MCGHICFIVPPHLLAAMAESEDQSLRQLGTKTLSMCEQIHQHRHEFFRNKLDHSHDGGARAQQGIVPDILLDHLSKADDVDESVKKSAQNSIALGMLNPIIQMYRRQFCTCCSAHRTYKTH